MRGRGAEDARVADEESEDQDRGDGVVGEAVVGLPGGCHGRGEMGD